MNVILFVCNEIVGNKLWQQSIVTKMSLTIITKKIDKNVTIIMMKKLVDKKI